MLTRKHIAALLGAGLAGALVALVFPAPATVDGAGAQLSSEPASVAQVQPRRAASEVVRLTTRVGPSLDPLRDDYDPLPAVLDGASGAELFHLEPRRPAWAEPVEGRIRAQLDRDLELLFPDAALEQVECRTSTCELSVVVDADQAQALYEHVLVSPVGSSLSKQRVERPDGRTELRIVAVIAHDVRDDYLAWQADERRAVLDRMEELGAHPPAVLAKLRSASQ